MTTSTSSNSDQRQPTKETVDVSVLREIARNSLVHALNSVSPFPSRFLTCGRLQFPRSTVQRLSCWTHLWLDHLAWSQRSLCFKYTPATNFFFDDAYDGTQQHGVDKMFWLESGPLSAVTTNIVYLCRPRIKWVKIIAGTSILRLLLDLFNFGR